MQHQNRQLLWWWNAFRVGEIWARSQGGPTPPGCSGLHPNAGGGLPRSGRDDGDRRPTAERGDGVAAPPWRDPASSKKRRRDSERALVREALGSLESKIATRRHPTSEESECAAKKLLATRTLANAIVKACVKENVSTSGDVWVIRRLLEEYRPEHPPLSRRRVVDGIRKCEIDRNIAEDGAAKEDNKLKNRAEIEAIRKSREEAASTPEECDECAEEFAADGAADFVVDSAPTKEPTKELRRGAKRKANPLDGHPPVVINVEKPSATAELGIDLEGQEGEPVMITSVAAWGLVARHLAPRGFRWEALVGMKVDRINGARWTSAQSAIGYMKVARKLTIVASGVDYQYPEVRNPFKQRVRRPYGPREEKDTPVNRLIAEVFKRYVVEKRKYNDKLPNGRLETLVEDTRKECGMESVDLSIQYAKSKLLAKWRKLREEDEEVKEATLTPKLIADEVYARYERVRNQADGAKAPHRLIKSLVEGVLMERGATTVDVDLTVLRSKIQARYRREHPEAPCNGVPGQVSRASMSEEQRRRKRRVMDEVTARYAAARDACAGKSLPNGTLAGIIRETKDQLGIHEFEITRQMVISRCSTLKLFEGGNARRRQSTGDDDRC